MSIITGRGNLRGKKETRKKTVKIGGYRDSNSVIKGKKPEKGNEF